MAEMIARLKVDSSEYDAKIKRAAQGLQHFVQKCHEQGDVIGEVLGDTRRYVESLGKMGTVATTVRGKIGELTAGFTEIRSVYNSLSDEEKNAPFGKELSRQLEIMKGRINESKAELAGINNELNGGNGLNKALDAVAGKFGVSTDMLTKFGGGMAVLTTAMKVAKDAFMQSESNIDEWGRTVEGAKGAYGVFLDTLNNGNWSNFFQNLQTAIQGGRDLYDVFDRLGSIKSNNAAAIALTQKEIAELRLAKQQGENVDAKLKAATERLAALQKQQITAGKAAGTESAFQVIRNGVNSAGGAGVNDATINYAIQRIMQNGQSEFDRYKYNYDTLQKKGTRYNVWTNKESFSMSNLTQEEQRQYALSKAITEGETRIQKGIAAFAQAVQEGTASAREEFKGNRYALQGSTGGGGGKGGTTVAPPPVEGSIDYQTAKVQELQKAWRAAADDDSRLKIKREIEEQQYALDRMTGKEKFDPSKLKKVSGMSSMTTGMTLTLPKTISIQSPVEKWKSEIAELKQAIADAWDPSSVEVYQARIAELEKNIGAFTGKSVKGNKESEASFRAAAQAVNSVGSALQSIEDPSAKIAGIVGSAIANIALGFAEASSKEGKGGVWYWIAATAAGLANMVSTIATIHSATGYAQGGRITGTTYSGDQIGGLVDGQQLVGLNAGEIVLNQAMQNNVASALRDGSQGLTIVGEIQGEKIVLAANRFFRRTGQGEIVTW